MQLLFTRRPIIGASFIRAVTWSDWSHVEVVSGPGQLTGAGFPHGVTVEARDARLALASKAALMTIPTPNEADGTQFLRDQLGKPYDWLGALGLAFHRDWQEDDAWWCSELAAAAVQAAGMQLFRDGAIRRVTPQNIWVQNYPVEVLK